MATREQNRSLVPKSRISRRSATWIAIIILLNIELVSSQLGATEIDALNDIKASIVPANLWDTSNPDQCAWPGISCIIISNTQYVFEISLYFGTSFQIAIPATFQNFANINSLSIANATLTAPLPNLGAMKAIQLTNVSNIQWSASSSLRNINLLYCTMDALPVLSNYPSLQYYILIGGSATNNAFSITCPQGYGLLVLHIARIAVVGSIPDLTGCTSIQIVILSDLGLLSGQLQSLAVSTVLQLTYSGNQLTGTIPPEIIALKTLFFLDLSYNKLSGTLDPAVFSKPALVGLSLVGNQFEGTIPDTFQTSALSALALGSNKLNGTIPSSLVAHPKTTLLDLQNNQLTGTIPKFAAIGLTTLKLNNNQFTGTIPDIFYSNVTYSQIDLSNNQLIGSIPASLYRAQNITTALSLANNTLSGCVETAQYTVPQLCDLSGNFFCCKSDTPLCPVVTNCRTCPLPKPTENATCIVDSNGNPVWLVIGDLIISANNTNSTAIQNGYVDGNLVTITSVTIDGVTVTGNLTVIGDLTVNAGVIKVQGCAYVNGSLTLNLTPEEIDQLSLNGTITRDLIQYDALCADSTVKFDTIVVQGDVDCTELTGKQQNSPGLVSIVVTASKIDCPVITPNAQPSPPNQLPDWAIGVIVGGSCLIVGVIIMAVLVSRHLKLKKKEKGINQRMVSASTSVPPLQ